MESLRCRPFPCCSTLHRSRQVYTTCCRRCHTFSWASLQKKNLFRNIPFPSSRYIYFIAYTPDASRHEHTLAKYYELCITRRIMAPADNFKHFHTIRFYCFLFRLPLQLYTHAHTHTHISSMYDMIPYERYMHIIECHHYSDEHNDLAVCYLYTYLGVAVVRCHSCLRRMLALFTLRAEAFKPSPD